jgi:probable HAF family extracellular repeat protein
MKKLFKKGVVAAACIAGMLAGHGSAHAESYNAIDLGAISQSLFGNYTLGGMPDNKAFGINDSGTVVGILKGSFGSSQTHIISWNISSDGKTAIGTDQGTQPLLNVSGVAKNGASTKSYGYGINGSGQIVGYTQPTGQAAYFAFLYDTTTKTGTYLGTPAGSGQSTATAINNSGQVVGFTGEGGVGAYPPSSAFIYSNGTINRIPGATVGSSSPSFVSSAATSISNSGLVTGYSTTSGNYARAFIYNTSNLTSDINNSTSVGFQSLGTLAGLSSNINYYGIDINDSGAVVGYTSETAVSGPATQLNIPFSNVTNPHAFLYTNSDGMIDLGALGGTGYSQANAINNAGTIVGTSNGRAFMYKDNQMIDLNTLIEPSSGIFLTNALDINNQGQIVGYGKLITGTNADGSYILGEQRAFAVTPTPIPPTVLLFASGLSGMFFLRRRKPSKES